MDITYTKRAKGGYYAFTDVGVVIVERHYVFHEPTNVWIARHRGTTIFGESRKGVVEDIVRRGRG